MMDRMESEGYVTPAKGQSPRKVLLTPVEFKKKYTETSRKGVLFEAGKIV